MGMSLITAPTREPITLTEAKAHLRIDHADEDGLIAAYLLAARSYAEGFTKRALVPQTWELTLSGFPAVIELPLPPLMSVTSVQYVDRDGVTQTLNSSQYVVTKDGPRGLIFPAYDQRWPEARHHGIAVIVRFQAGYDDTPLDIRLALLMLTAHFYEMRQPVTGGGANDVPITVDALLSPYRVVSFG